MAARYRTQRKNYQAKDYLDRAREMAGSDGFVHEPCGRCGGSGRLEAYRHVEGGMCFACVAQGLSSVTKWTVEEWAGILADAAYKADRKAEKAERNREKRYRQRLDLCESFPHLALLTYPELVAGSEFLADMHEVIMYRPEKMTQRQIDAAGRALVESLPVSETDRRTRREAERDAARRDAPEGRQVVRGTVVEVHSEQNGFARTGGLVHAMKVRVDTADGGHYLVRASVPAGIQDACRHRQGFFDAERLSGQLVEFTATLEPGREPHFAFGKRPTKARVVASVAA